MENLEISQIVVNKETQARVAISEDMVQDYAERMLAGDEFPPVDVFNDGSEYCLADGFHRVLAAKRALFESIQCNIHAGTVQDAKWFAIGANKTNGQRMNRGDIKRAVEVALMEFPDQTQRVIADHIGCSQGLITRYKKELITCNKLNIPDKRTGADGKERPTTYNKQEPETEKGDTNELDNRIIEPARNAYTCGVMQAARAIRELERIGLDDPERKLALNKVKGWIEENE